MLTYENVISPMSRKDVNPTHKDTLITYRINHIVENIVHMILCSIELRLIYAKTYFVNFSAGDSSDFVNVYFLI